MVETIQRHKRGGLYFEDFEVGKLYEHGKAVNIAPFLAFDDVIDPADTRHWLARSLQALPPEPVRTGKRRPNIDPW